MGSSETSPPLHVFFFPLMAQGHLIPMTEIASLFALREGVRVSIVTTPINATRIQSTIHETHNITIHLLQFPCSEAGLPDGCETRDSVTTPDMIMAFLKALTLLHRPFEQLVDLHRPDCIVSDMFFPWTVDVAAKLSIPRLVFHGTSQFSLCVSNSIRRYSPHESLATETEPFMVPDLPHPIELTRSQIADFSKSRSTLEREMIEKVHDADKRSYGVVVNSFYELEPDYAKHYKEKVRGSSKVWNVGPVSLCNSRDQKYIGQRGEKAVLDPSQCLGWLDSREPGSVIYVCFGSFAQLGRAQLMEIALALEKSGRPFIWVVRNVDKLEEEKWVPDGFEKRTKGRGLIINGWAPQVMILEHPGVGGFVTHCGWNSVLEGVTAGVPMLTWPVFAEQFYNEKLVTRVLEIGVEVGAQVWTRLAEERPVIGWEMIERAVRQVMDGGDKGKERRTKARELSEMAKRAVEMGGSSYLDLDRLIQEMRMYVQQQSS